MATPTFVQNKSVENNSNPSSVSVTFTNPTVSGNFIYVAFTTDTTSATAVTAVTDNFGNSYTKIAGTAITGGTGSLHRWYAKAIGGGVSHAITATLSGTPDINMIAQEYSGVDPNNPLVSSNQGSASSGSTWTSGKVTPTTTNPCLVIAVGGTVDGSGNNITVGAGYGNFTKLNTTVAFMNLGIEDKVVTSVSDTTSVMTGAATGAWIISADVFKSTFNQPTLNRLRPHPFSPGLAR